MHTNELADNGHETKGQLAARNLGHHISGLEEMRWMVMAALGDKAMGVAAFDESVELLRLVLETVKK